MFRASPLCNHHDNAAYILEHGSGTISAGCHHNSCSWTWQDLRGRLEPKATHAQGQTNQNNGQPAGEIREDKVQFEGITSSELAAGDYSLDYLVEWLLVQGQSCVIAGSKKVFKTNISIDLALSLSIGEQSLGMFNVPNAVRVGLMSGEIGEATIQETAWRIANSKHWSLDNFDNAIWEFAVPQLGRLDHTDALRAFVIRHELDVLIVDPTFIAMAEVGDSAGNLLIVGRVLKSLVDLSAETGVTPILIHHLRKSIADPFAPPELEDIAWAGFQEFMRQ